MPFVSANGIRLSYQRSGQGEPVLLVMGSGAAGRVWTMHQTPALNRAGYETIVFDNRGIAPSSTPPGDYSLADMTADTLGLIEALDVGPCRIVGTSMGAMIAQELALVRPDLVRCAVLMATKARSDATRRMLLAAERELRADGIALPPRYEAVRTVLEMLSPTTLNDDATVSGWLELFELTTGQSAPGQHAVDTVGDRREALRGLGVPCRAISFSDDLICPPHLVAEVADAIPDCDYVEIPGCGHLGNLENPDAVNTAIIEFLDKH
ncbi:alpha/beta hydrolase [Streptomyces hygroscopicus]|uniref:alpha/beta fold hydrolase n=1 Tax=Streptomyces hygroscopicus TaxID=1912 RepID=UPI0022404A7C|nr:alpha/beta fold hydrolase [Streptomyces hygroscopicus]MCW7941474.1 alpha/beta hydrolase [Streptomyces hygroscopicus]